MKIAIIGGGLSGASVLKTIINHSNFKKEDQIDIFETRERLGVGFPYDTDTNSLMLNIEPERLSVVDNQPNDFVKWLEKNYDQPENFEGLISRPQYGNYLEERHHSYFTHPQVTHQKEEVIDLNILFTKNEPVQQYTYQIKTKNGWEESEYDAVFFSVGHPAYADYYQLKGAKNYIHNPYPAEEKLAAIDVKKKVGIIGSGATGIDLMRYFSQDYPLEHPITYYVQDEAFYFADIPYEGSHYQMTISEAWIKKTKQKNKGYIPLDKIIKTIQDDLTAGGVDLKEVYQRYQANDIEDIRKALKNNDQDLALVHQYVADLIQFLPVLYNNLNALDKKCYLKNYHSKLIFFKSRVPNKTFKWLLELLDEGKIRIVWGLKEIEKQKDDSFRIIADHEENVDFLINATGFDTRLEKASENSTLIKNLYKKEIILPQINGRFVFVTWPQAQIINQRFGLMKNAFFFGTLIGGTQHENNDAQLTIKQATYSANWFMNHL